MAIFDRTALTSLDRRRLLRLAGLGSGTLFLPSLLGRREARAAVPPKRLVLMETQHGQVFDKWEFGKLNGLDAGRSAEWELPLANLTPTQFSDSLRPLHAVRNDVVIIEGLSTLSALIAGEGNNHNISESQRFTGGSENGKFVSFDQHIADAVAVPGRFKYLCYSNASNGASYGLGVWDTAGNPVKYERTVPARYGFLNGAYDRVFKDLAPVGTAPTPVVPPKPTPLQISADRRNDAVDFLRSEYARLSLKLSGDDRKKLELHQAMLADLKRDVAGIAQQQQMNLSCARPANPPLETSDTECVTKVMANLFPIAMACDLTRVAECFVLPPTASEIGAPSGLDMHQDIAHASADNPQAQQWMANYHAIHARQFAAAVAAFKSVPEGNGTMLDNSVLVWIPELGNANHMFHRMQVVIAGGLGGAIKPGRYLKYGENLPNPSNMTGGKVPLGPALNKLYVSIMQAMGLNRNSIGTTSGKGTSYLPGAPIDLTGPLPRLRG